MIHFANAKLLDYSLNRFSGGTFRLERTVLPYMDLTFLFSGEMTYYYNYKKIILKSGDAILFPQGSVRARDECNARVEYASINIRFETDFTPEIGGQIKGTVTPAITLQLEILENIWNTATEHRENICNPIIASLYYQLLASTEKEQNPTIALIKQYISSNITKKLSLGEVAATAHWSPAYCSAEFKRITGKNIIEYINEEKMAYAKRMIIKGDLSLGEIAENLGYMEYSYFFRVFKKVTGHAPGYYIPM